MSGPDGDQKMIARKIVEIDNRIAELQAEGRDNGDEAIRKLRDARESLVRERAALGGNVPADRESREDPVTGRDLQEQSQTEAIRQSLRRY